MGGRDTEIRRQLVRDIEKYKRVNVKQNNS